MAAYSAGQVDVYIKPESTYGTAVDPVGDATVAPGEALGLHSSVNFSIDDSATTVRRIGSRAPSDVIVGQGMVSGSVDFTYYGLFPFYWALGKVADADAATPWTWTITDANTLPDFTMTSILDGTNDLDFQVSGCICTGLSMNVGVDGPLTGSFGFIGQDLILAGATTIATTSVDDAPACDAGQLAVQVPNDTALTNVTSATLNIANSAAVIHRIGARKAASYHTGGLDITGSLDVFVEDAADGQDLLQQVLGSTSSNGIADTVDENTLTLDYKTYADSDSDSWEIDLSGVTFNTGSFNQGLDGPATMSIGFIAEDISCLWEAPVTNDDFQ